MPFDLVPIHGKVTFEDGSRIDAESLLVTFNPIPSGPTGPMTAPGAKTQVNVADGTFAAVSTRRSNDGITTGRHKVVVVSLKKGPNGMPVATNVVPAKYQKETTTPLEIEVSSANQFVEIKVSKK